MENIDDIFGKSFNFISADVLRKKQDTAFCDLNRYAFITNEDMNSEANMNKCEKVVFEKNNMPTNCSYSTHVYLKFDSAVGCVQFKFHCNPFYVTFDDPSLTGFVLEVATKYDSTIKVVTVEILRQM